MSALSPDRVDDMAATRPQCPQCATSNPALVEFGLFALDDTTVDELLTTRWVSPENFSWQCGNCKHEWGVGA